MALSGLRHKVTNENIKQEIQRICGDNKYLKSQIEFLFSHYVNYVVIPEVAEILKVVYDGDVTKICKDIVSVKIAGLDGRKDNV